VLHFLQQRRALFLQQHNAAVTANNNSGMAQHK
jgi:hypothetical protein